MFELIIAAVVGLFVGWNLPQPAYAKYLQEKFMSFFKSTPPTV